jgi:AcrR family transcriptional regulator
MMANVARTLRVTAPALYRRFATREALTAACLTAIGREQTPVPDGLPWREYLSALAEQLWAVLLRHPGLDEVMWTFPRSLGDPLDPTGDMVRGLTHQGFTTSQIVFATQYLADLATTSVALLQRRLPTPGEYPGAGFTDEHHFRYRVHVDTFLDRLTALAPDFPEMTGPLAVPLRHERQLR